MQDKYPHQTYSVFVSFFFTSTVKEFSRLPVSISQQAKVKEAGRRNQQFGM